MDAAKNTALQLIQDNKVMVFSKSYCPYCRSTKALFEELVGLSKMKVYELDMEADGADIQAALADKKVFDPKTVESEHGLKLKKTDDKAPNHRSVPNVWVGGEQIGGDDDVKAAFKSGKLQKLLQAAGVELL